MIGHACQPGLGDSNRAVTGLLYAGYKEAQSQPGYTGDTAEVMTARPRRQWAQQAMFHTPAQQQTAHCMPCKAGGGTTAIMRCSQRDDAAGPLRWKMIKQMADNQPAQAVTYKVDRFRIQFRSKLIQVHRVFK